MNGLGDVNEMLEILHRKVFEDVIFCGQLQRDAHHSQRESRHPGRAVRLVEIGAVRQRGPEVEKSDIVKTQETALKYISSVMVLAIDPPGEVQHQLMKDALQKRPVADA